MFALRRLGAVVVAVVLSACGGGSGGSSLPSKPQLQSSLLSVSDVGGAWKAGQAINDQDLAAFAQARCDSATIDAAVAKRLTAVTGVQFEPTDRSYRHLIELVVTGKPAQLAQDLRTVFSAVESCATGAASGATVKKLSVPDLGDQRAAYAITRKGPGGSASMMSLRAGYVRKGSVAAVVGLTDFQASAQGVSQITDDAYRTILQKAAAKLAAAT